MLNYLLALITGIVLGAAVSFIFKKNNDSKLFNMLCEFKKSIDDYKLKNDIILEDTIRLTKTLTTNQNLKGQFGEECLEVILKACYPDENINYIKQFRAQNEEGCAIKPDYLVKLPNDKSILIDCKLNLEKYLEYKESDSKKQEFIKDLNATINLLSNKKYQTAKNIQQPDFILMYIPLEPVITLIYTDKDFLSVIKNANEKNIIIVGNSSILTTLRLTKLLWAQDKQEKNIENIVSMAQNIYNLIAEHSCALYEIKNTLKEASEHFNKEYEKLSQNNSLFKDAELLREYGIQAVNKKSGKKLNEIKVHSDFLG